MSSRSVSRWENGNTMLDISILVELADYYDVDIRELLNGERKNENMNEDMKETLTMVADYAEKQKKQAIIIAFQCVSNLMIVFGLLPMTGSFLPMISHGTSRNIVNYMLFGLILSIYRYKDIRKEDMMKSVLAKGKVAI